MKYRKFKQEKLWRDKAVDLLEAMGSRVHWVKLEGEGFKEQLRVKLLEEAAEVCDAKNKEELLEELADLLDFHSLKPSLDTFKEYYRLSSKIEEEVEEENW